jgi:mono/diheme cytochrome c family protein
VGPDIGPGSNADVTLTDDQIAAVITVGPGSMPSFGNSLTEEQIASLVAYIRAVQDG